MEIDDLVVMAYIFGGLAVLLSTILRYLLSLKMPSSRKRRKLFDAIKIIDVHQDKPEVRLMLFQYTGMGWLLMGTSYLIMSNRFMIQGVAKHIFEVLVLVVPGILLAIIMRILKRLYW
jgi:hypothetical protein